MIAKVSGLVSWAVRERDISLAFGLGVKNRNYCGFARLAGLCNQSCVTLFAVVLFHDKEKYADRKL